jgi:pimeloyl-ACP methyl ester carboxylesterase
MADTAQTRNRRRWPWILAGVAAVLVVLYLAVGWYVSSLLGDGIRIDRPGPPSGLTIESADDDTVAYTNSEPDGAWADIGYQAVTTEDGEWVRTKPGDTPGTREVIEAEGLPDAGETAKLDGEFFQEDPKTGLGLDFEEVQIDTPLGPAPAWLVPGSSDTWAIFTHGRGYDRKDGLRALSVTHEMGYPTLVITYRNDDGAPAANGYGQFGKDEWEDLQAAVDYAQANGAEDIVLIGNSMGGAIEASFLLKSADASAVKAVFWDSPELNFESTVDDNAEELGVPGFVTAWGKALSSWRYGVDFSGVDYVARAQDFDVPILIGHSTTDDVVFISTSRDFVAAADPSLVRLEEFDGADHTGLWNSERERYETLMREFLEEHAPV